MNFNQFKNLVVIPTLEHLDPEIPFSDTAVDLLMMTVAHESSAARFLQQFNGPALGVFQMEPATEKDIFDNYLKYRAPLLNKVKALMSEQDNQLVVNLGYAAAMARIHYFRDHKALPVNNPDSHQLYLEALGDYAKRVYNTAEGKATSARYVSDYTAWKTAYYY